MKKIFIAFAALIMSAFLFAGCKAEDTDSMPETTTTTTTEATTETMDTTTEAT